MGDLQTDQGDSLELRYVPVGEFRRLLDAPATAAARAEAFAALARINTLYMIAGAWSGHIGTGCQGTRTSRRHSFRRTPAHSGWACRKRRVWRSPTASRGANAASSC